ncbi:hypothetical protein [Haloferax elongans]|nr:hypothetical protein [Haloferax elongans]
MAQGTSLSGGFDSVLAGERRRKRLLSGETASERKNSKSPS